jgi:hypothetical protein
MLVQKVTLRFVKNLNIPFKYTLLTRARRKYYKDYEVDVPLVITKEQSTPTDFINNSTVLIEYKKNLYWCPQVEEMYKTLKTAGRNTLSKYLDISLKGNYPTLTIKGRVGSFITNDVKVILIKDE